MRILIATDGSVSQAVALHAKCSVEIARSRPAPSPAKEVQA
jgi:nucleotide-binding universal stress UspA family protein